jgi:hypothetical protein
MDRAMFCEDTEAKLRELDEYLRTQVFVSPSTRERALQQERRRPVLESMRARVAEISAQVEQLRTSDDPQWEQSRAVIEQDCAAIKRELEELEEAR